MTGTRKFEHITPVLRQLHWLPVRQRIAFKLVMITFKCLHGLAPSYLADVCTPVSSVVSRLSLPTAESANSGALVVPRTRTTIGRRDFAVAGPATWVAVFPWRNLRIFVECDFYTSQMLFMVAFAVV